MQPEIDLSGLKDLHEMVQPSWWPLAYGWWVLIVGVVVVVLLGICVHQMWRNRPDVYAVRKIKKLNQAEKKDLAYIKKVSQLLRRVAMAADGRAAVAKLSDVKWQQFLMARAPETLSEQEAHLIAFAPYEMSVKKSIHRDVFTEHVCEWIKKVLKNKKSS